MTKEALPRYSKAELARINADRSTPPEVAPKAKRQKKEKEWPTIRTRTNKGGTISYVVDAGRRLSQTRERFSFETEKEANLKAEALRQRLKNEGRLSRQLSDRERNEAAECLEQLKAYKVGFRAVTDFYIKHHKVVTGEAATTRQLFEEFQINMVERKLSPSYRRAMEDYVGPFVVAHPGPIELVMAETLDKWVKSWSDSDHSRWHFSNYVGTFFNWCRDLKKALPKGETEADALRFSKPKPTRIEVYTPEEMLLYLKYAKDDGERALLALGGFVGLRNSEITGEKTAHPPLQAEDILFEGDAVRTIQKVQNESVERYAPMTKNAASWLAPFKGKTGPVIVCTSAGAVLHDIAGRAAVDGHKIPFKRNGLRRSHITYRTALKRNPGVVADECNTSEQKIKANYRRKDILVETARRWVAIRRTA